MRTVKTLGNTKKKLNVRNFGDFEIHKLNLISPKLSTGKTKQISLHLVYSNFSIYEDLFSNCISGSITIVDASDLLNEFPIIGEETLEVDWRATRTQVSCYLKLRVVGISKIEKINDTTKTYTLLLSSKESIISEKTRISKSFSINRLHKIVKKVCEDYLKLKDVSDVPDKTVDEITLKDKNKNDEYFEIVTETDYNTKYIAANYSPFRTLNNICSKALSKRGYGSLFFFYQSIDGFKFVSLEDLFRNSYLKDKKTLKQLVYVPKGTQDVSFEWNNVLNYEIDKRFDVFDNMSKGMYSSLVYYIDYMNQDFKKQNYYYQVDSKKHFHVENEKFMINTENADFLHDDTKKEEASSVKLVLPTYSGDFVSGDTKTHEIETMQNRFSQLKQITNFLLRVEIYGDTSGDVNVGDVIHFSVPHTGLRDKNEDDYYTGRYLVTRIHHYVSKAENYMMLLELSKDVLGKSFEYEKDDDSESKKATGIELTLDEEKTDRMSSVYTMYDFFLNNHCEMKRY